MKVSRSLGYQFSIQQYESIKVQASATVESGDIGVTLEALAAFTEEQLEEHIKELEEFCDEMLERQLKPLLAEADEMCERQSSAHDVSDYHKGRQGS